MEAIRDVVTARSRAVQQCHILADHLDSVEGKFGLRLVMQKK